MNKPKIPEDLGIKIGTKEEVFWTGMRDKTKEAIEQCKHEMIIQTNILKMAEELIEKEKKIMKGKD